MKPVRPILFVAALAAAVSSSRPLLADGELGAVEPSVEEQFAIWALNKARHDPTKYGEKVGADFSLIATQPPLAVNKLLTGSSRFHAKEMLDNNYFGHVSEVTGIGPNQMAVNNGYDAFGLGLGNNWTIVNTIESNAKGVKLIPTFDAALALLIIDKGVSGVGHRKHLMALNQQFAEHREIGAGRAAKGTTYVYSIHTANVSVNDRFLTGVVFSDTNGDGRFGKGEGIGGVTVDAGSGHTTTSLVAGGWSIQVPQGQYTVTASGGSFRGTGSATVSVSGANREIDFMSGRAAGEVDFSGTSGPRVSFTATPQTGPAQLAVMFAASSTPAGAAFAWDFGDTGIAAGDVANHTYVNPGLYSARLDGTDATGTGSAVHVIAVDGPDGAGASTTPPVSRAVTVTKFKAKAVFTAAGKDSVSFKGTFEMPAGWTPGQSDVVVDVAGVRQVFDLVAADTLTDANGNKIALKYKRPKTGALPAGVLATVTVTLKGDVATALRYAGLRGVTESRLVDAADFCILLGQLAYTGTAKYSVKSTAASSSAALAK